MLSSQNWFRRPVQAPPSGCVPTPEVPRSFGLASVLTVITSLAAVSGLAWMWTAGHAAEVIGAVLAAVLTEIIAAPVRSTVDHLRRGGKL
ncbi:hypothetical protein ACFWSF_39805 [Streptomyces sp. NPDC058611]|uniref:hypothetical protein n=1 Tax=unclassified Streptomyces TaxID=2593676 RepID=UPI00364775B1